ncbi:unnamed protein product [Tuber aestivum]|uniref:Uncharacterized protein n=1 Tax=Tuber aestivum TaxID=59557 RepID=A0A292PU09_9PEZI|nr:unnamed protein product [Tuber aestivum]
MQHSRHLIFRFSSQPFPIPSGGCIDPKPPCIHSLRPECAPKSQNMPEGRVCSHSYLKKPTIMHEISTARFLTLVHRANMRRSVWTVRSWQYNKLFYHRAWKIRGGSIGGV